MSSIAIGNAFTDGYLLMLLNHEDAFLGPEGPLKDCMGYQTAPNSSLGYHVYSV